MTNFVCEFCKRKFVKEISLIDHSCEKKRRWFSKDEPAVRFAFMAWNRFYELNSFGKKLEYRNNFQNFINSRYYTSFLKFGKHMVDLNVIEPGKFIEYVLKNNLPIDKWTHDFVYEQYVHELLVHETPESALERTVLLMKDWSLQTSEPWFDFFRKINTNQAVAWIKTGRISPWLLYNADSAVDFFERCTPEQINMIKKHAPTDVWKIKINKNKDSCNFIKQTLKESGI